jgi:hypothetical protein
LGEREGVGGTLSHSVAVGDSDAVDVGDGGGEVDAEARKEGGAGAVGEGVGELPAVALLRSEALKGAEGVPARGVEDGEGDVPEFTLGEGLAVKKAELDEEGVREERILCVAAAGPREGVGRGGEGVGVGEGEGESVPQDEGEAVVSLVVSAVGVKNGEEDCVGEREREVGGVEEAFVFSETENLGEGDEFGDREAEAHWDGGMLPVGAALRVGVGKEERVGVREGERLPVREGVKEGALGEALPQALLRGGEGVALGVSVALYVARDRVGLREGDDVTVEEGDREGMRGVGDAAALPDPSNIAVPLGVGEEEAEIEFPPFLEGVGREVDVPKPPSQKPPSPRLLEDCVGEAVGVSAVVAVPP